MEYRVDKPPDEVLAQAVGYMVGQKGCNIDQANEYSVTFEWRDTNFGVTDAILALDTGFGKQGNTSATLNQTKMLMSLKATLVARDGRVLLGGYGPPSQMLHDWLVDTATGLGGRRQQESRPLFRYYRCIHRARWLGWRW
jgi:hypothetical protein